MVSSSAVARSRPPSARRPASASEGYDDAAARALRRRGVLAPVLGLLALVAVVFGGTLGHGFVYDDQFLVVENRLLESPASWPELFRTGSWAGAGIDARNYRPLPLLTMAWNRWWGGLEPAGYHAVNLLAHALAAVLLYALGRRLALGRPAAWLAAALFAVHPLQAEPVSEIVGRMDLMAGAAMLAALLAHLALRERQLDGRPPWAMGAAAVALYAAGLLSKEHVVLFPAVAAVWDLGRRRELPLRRALPVHAAYAAAAAGYLALRAAVFGGELLAGAVSRLDNPLAHVAPALRFVSALGVAGRYLGHAALPTGLSPEYCYAQVLPLESIGAPSALLTMLATAVLAAGALALARRSPRAALAIALGAAAFLPVSNLLFPIGTVMGDRLFYLPLAALALLVGFAVERLAASRPRVSAAIAATVLAALAAGAAAQTRHWRDSYALSRRAVAAAPLCARGHSNLGYDLLERGELAGAAASFARALELYPEQPKAEVGLATVAIRRAGDIGALDDAARRLERALGLDSRSSAALEVAAEVARRRGDADAARRYWERRLALDPNHAPTLSNLALLEWTAGRPEPALALWRRAAAQPGAPAEVWRNLSAALSATGANDEAAAAWSRYESARAASGAEGAISGRRRNNKP